MIYDTHMHCDYSCDSEMKFADAIGAAAEQGIGITVTEHWDYDYPTNPAGAAHAPLPYTANNGRYSQYAQTHQNLAPAPGR